jgi:predicted ATPase
LLLQQPRTPPAEAEAWLQRALDVARRQEAKSLELRAAMSLSRLWQQQGRQAEAYALLASVYGWFTEGFDTADLQEARALLEDLSP